MAFEPEELQRRRQERAQRRQQQAAQQRRMWIRLGIAGAVLLACGLLIFLLSRGGSQTDTPETTQSVPAESQPQSPTETTAKAPTTTIRFAAAGDLNITDGVVAAGGAEYDYTHVFMDVAHLLADADIAALNFEGNLLGAPYGSATVSAPQNLVQALDRAGVDLIQLANSYSIHDGVSGLATTIAGIRAAGMEPLGVYADQQAYKAGKGYTIRNVMGVKVAVVAFTKGMNGMALPAGSENCVNVLYTDYNSAYQTVDTEGITAVLEAVNKEKPDVTIAMLHWGSEFNDTISESQEKIADLMISLGVDAIVGTHSHYVQQMVYDPEAGTFVAYSLGDFFGDAQRAGTEYSVILELEITKDNESGETKVTNYNYTPIFTFADENGPIRVLRIKEAMAAYEAGFIDRVSAEAYEAMKYALGRIEARVTGE